MSGDTREVADDITAVLREIDRLARDPSSTVGPASPAESAYRLHEAIAALAVAGDGRLADLAASWPVALVPAARIALGQLYFLAFVQDLPDTRRSADRLRVAIEASHG
ncbi:hypothetical protein L2U69_18620 [Zavarzinia compransoris]|uniref:hypothetical protein n=1 Tax=Zavarzinia marina TaxID=2911065 RepID=UPI001F2B1896|nr:hypothetical protein [Zavarzinia marina]MCF4167666.1 hypothetical protein [Zavarzinia marina]